MDTSSLTDRTAPAAVGARRDGAPLVRVAVAGATGFAGQELLRWLAGHPHARVTAAMSSSPDGPVRSLPSLARIWDGVVEPFSASRLADDADVVFLALPEEAAAAIAPALVERGVRVIDLSGAFRLRDAAAREKWYPATRLGALSPVYGLTERNYPAIRGAQLVTNPGCYPTAALLALEPLAEAGLLAGDIVIDAKSGISGAGKRPTDRTHFSENHGSVSAYGVFGHRHQPEIEQELGAAVTFVPHLVPLDRGILETIYARVRAGTTADDVAEIMGAAYRNAPFVRLTGEALPEIRHAAYTNFCDIGWRVDVAGSRILLVAVIDNLVKGAAGQAIQNLNVALGFDETAGPASAEEMTQRASTAPVVLKFGGELLETPGRVAALAAAIAKTSRKTHLVIVHGGGREIDAALARVGIEKQQVDGLRITDEPTLEVVVSVLAGLVNTRFVAALGAVGVAAVGLTGADAGVARVKAAPRHVSTRGETVDLGRVGEPVGREKPALLMDLCRKGYLPVVSSVAAARDGRLYNVNADTFAAHLAGRLGSPRLIIAGATAGVLDGDGATIADMTLRELDTLVASGGATAGMVAKLAACRSALESGAREVFVADGRDIAGLLVLARHGRTAGAAASTKIRNGKQASNRKVNKRAS